MVLFLFLILLPVSQCILTLLIITPPSPARSVARRMDFVVLLPLTSTIISSNMLILSLNFPPGLFFRHSLGSFRAFSACGGPGVVRLPARLHVGHDDRSLRNLGRGDHNPRAVHLGHVLGDAGSDNERRHGCRSIRPLPSVRVRRHRPHQAPGRAHLPILHRSTTKSFLSMRTTISSVALWQMYTTASTSAYPAPVSTEADYPGSHQYSIIAQSWR